MGRQLLLGLFLVGCLLIWGTVAFTEEPSGDSIPGIVIYNNTARLDSSQTLVDAGSQFICDSGTAQSFKAYYSGKLNKVELYLETNRIGTQVYVKIRRDTARGIILGVSQPCVITPMYTPQWYTFEFDNVIVEKNATYVIEVISSRLSPTFWYGSYGSGQNAYSDGQALQVWNGVEYAYPTFDYAFKTYIQNEVHIWERSLDSDIKSIKETSDGNYIVAGIKGEIYLAKLDQTGKILWEKTHADLDGSDPKVEIFQAVQGTGGNIIWQKMPGFKTDERKGMGKTYNMILGKDGNIIVCATVNFYHNITNQWDQEICILKFDQDGNHLWSKFYCASGEEDCGWQIAENSECGFIVGALTDSAEITGGGYACLVFKLNCDGNFDWQRLFNIPGAVIPEFPSAILQTPDGKYLLGLETGIAQGTVIKFDQSGTIWQYTSQSQCKGIIEDPDGYLIYGFKRNLDDDIHLIKLNLNGQYLWQKSIPHPGNEDYWGSRHYPCQKCPDGYIFGCDTIGGYYLVKLDQAYNTQWERVYGKPGSIGYFTSLYNTADGGYILTGGWGWTIKLDSMGRDVTPPDAVSLVNDGVAVDVNWTTAKTELAANWEATNDAESGLARYWYAIGTAPGGTDILDWSDNGLNCSVSRNGLSLTNGIKYYFSVKAENGIGLYSKPTSSNGVVVDSVPPLLEQIREKYLESGSMVSWVTDEPATTTIEYGLTSDYGLTVSGDLGFVTSHLVPITGLAPKTLYHYRIVSQDAVGNTAYSNDRVLIPVNTNGLLACWNFDDSSGSVVTDSSLNNYPGNIVGGALWTAGWRGSGLLLNNNITNYVNLGSGTFGLTNELTISAWVKLNGDTGAPQVVIRRGQYVYPFSIVFNRGASFYGYWTITGIIRTTVKTFYANSSARIYPNQWHHIVITYKSGDLVLYVDYRDEANKLDKIVNHDAAGDFGFGYGPSETYIGAGPGLVTADFVNGVIDEFRIYNRALEPQEIGGIYAGTE
jgi:hypothetical protein